MEPSGKLVITGRRWLSFGEKAASSESEEEKLRFPAVPGASKLPGCGEVSQGTRGTGIRGLRGALCHAWSCAHSGSGHPRHSGPRKPFFVLISVPPSRAIKVSEGGRKAAQDRALGENLCLRIWTVGRPDTGSM